MYLAGSVHALPKERRGISRAARARLPRRRRDRAGGGSRRHESARRGASSSRRNGTLPADQTLADVVGAAPVPARQQTRGFARSARGRDREARALGRGAGAHAVRAHQDRLRRRISASTCRSPSARSADGKPVEGLETVIDQLSVFDARSFEEQTRFLLDSADDAPKLQRRPAKAHRRLARRRPARAREGIPQGTRQVAGALRRLVRQAQSPVAAEDRSAARGRPRLSGGGRHAAFRGPRRPARAAQAGWPQGRRGTGRSRSTR